MPAKGRVRVARSHPRGAPGRVVAVAVPGRGGGGRRLTKQKKPNPTPPLGLRYDIPVPALQWRRGRGRQGVGAPGDWLAPVKNGCQRLTVAAAPRGISDWQPLGSLSGLVEIAGMRRLLPPPSRVLRPGGAPSVFLPLLPADPCRSVFRGTCSASSRAAASLSGRTAGWTRPACGCVASRCPTTPLPRRQPSWAATRNASVCAAPPHPCTVRVGVGRLQRC